MLLGLLSALVVLGVVALMRSAPARTPSPSVMAADWDRRVRDMPQHADLRAISERLATVERTCDVVRAEMGSVKDAIGRVERQTNILIEHQIENSKQ